MKHWLKAFRLRTLPLSFSSILLGSALAYHVQNKDYGWINLFSDYDWKILILTLTTTLLLQILSNLANDYGDAKKGADNADRIGPERAIQSGAISPKAMLNAIIINAILALISGIFLLLVAFENKINITFIAFLILGIAAIAAAIKYTVGKKAYGYSGFGDVFVFLFFGIVGVTGTFFLHTHLLIFPIVLAAITMGCFSTAVLNLNNMRDRENDKKVGKNTLVVKLGLKKSKQYHYILFIIGYLAFPIPMAFGISEWPFYLISFIPVAIIHFFHIKKVIAVKNPKDFDPELKKVALSAFLFSLLFFVSVIIFL